MLLADARAKHECVDFSGKSFAALMKMKTSHPSTTLNDKKKTSTELARPSGVLTGPVRPILPRRKGFGLNG
jgi:hypothetical protein